MEIVYSHIAQEDLEYWKKSGDKQIQKKITQLLDDIVLHPKTGLGKPEQLKHELSNYWSRRISDKHRIIYRFSEETVYILSLKGHYYD